MKKIFIGILLTFCLFLNSQTFSYQLTEQENNAINQVVKIFQDKIIKNDEKMKDTLVAGLNKIITEYNPTDKNYEIIKILTEKIDEIEITTNTSSQENNLQQEDIRGENETTTETQNENIIYKVNITEVKDTWLERQNEVRTDLGLSEYTYSEKLDKTAQEWAEINKTRNDDDDIMNVHKRDLSDSYYDYNKIASWLKDRGIVCKNVNTVTFSESVAWTSYYCSENSTDCTPNFIDGLRVSFDRYMGERDKTENSRPHYNAIISKYFETIGMGIAIRQNTPTYYEVFITTHYCTELE